MSFSGNRAGAVADERAGTPSISRRIPFPRPLTGRLAAVVSFLPLVLGLLVAAPSAPAQALPVNGPVIDQDFADPDLVKVGDTYYAFATETVAMGTAGGATIQRARSTDLKSWTVDGGGVLTLPGWARSGRTWAPEVFQRADGKLVMWFTAWDRASGKQCIGTAVASGPESVFVPTDQNAATICPAADGGAIDASSFVEGSQRYILWKNDGNCCGKDTWISIQAVNGDGITLTGSTTKLVKQDQSYEGSLIEAPTLHKEGGTYVLFYSANSYVGDAYLVSYARSSSLLSGYVKAAAPLLTTQKLHQNVRGPGGQDVVIGADNTPKIVFHGWRSNNGYRGMYVQDLGFTGGYPVVAGAAVHYEAEDATLTRSRVRPNAAGASGGKVVGYIDYSDSSVEFANVYVPRAGSVTLRLRYAAGAGNASYGVVVDGADHGSVTLPSTGWDLWATATKDISLTAGTHRIRFTKGTSYAELDRLDVS